MMDIQKQMIDFPNGVDTTPGYLVIPDDNQKHPGIVLIQEWWGLVPHIKDVAERFAREGFIALAPDLYHGQASTEPDEARKLAMELQEEQATREIKAAVDYLGKMEIVEPKKIGIVGWCMGGYLALLMAESNPNLGASVVFYGHIHDVEEAKNIQSPLLGLFGENDKGIPVTLVHELDQKLDQSKVPHDIHIYPGAGHAFFNDSRETTYQPDAAKDAWKRTLDWFRTYLK